MQPSGITERRHGERRLKGDRRHGLRGGRRAADQLLLASLDTPGKAQQGSGSFVIVRLGRRASDPQITVPARLATIFLPALR